MEESPPAEAIHSGPELDAWLYKMQDHQTELHLSIEGHSQFITLGLDEQTGGEQIVSLRSVSPLDLGTEKLLNESRTGNVHCHIDGSQFQFDLQNIRSTPSQQGPRWQANKPDVLWRIQRREFYRVRPLPHQHVQLRFADAENGGAMISWPVVDLSLGGCSLALPAGRDHYPLHRLMEGAELLLSPGSKWPLHVFSKRTFLDEHGKNCLGCQFQNLSSDLERELSRHIQQIERLQRMMRQAG